VLTSALVKWDTTATEASDLIIEESEDDEPNGIDFKHEGTGK
jgi:hypothetical protein